MSLMDLFLEMHPKERKTHRLLQRIVTGSRIPLSRYVEKEDLWMIRHIYKKRLYRLKEVRRSMRKVAKEEGNAVQKKMYRMLCGRGVVFGEFTLKMAFLQNFPRFREQFKDCRDVEYNLQRLLYEHIHSSRDVQSEASEIFLELEPTKLYLYFDFFRRILDTKGTIEVLEQVEDEFKPSVLTVLPEDEYYRQLSKLILRAAPAQKVLLISSLENVDRARLYRNLAEQSMQRVTTDHGCFKEFLEIMKMLHVEKDMKIRLMHAWLRTFVYLRRIDEFLKLFEQLRHLDGGAEDFKLFLSFHNVIREYKRRKVLDFDEFLERCREAKEENEFAIYSWEAIAMIYRG
jgi:hypothetical protein